MEWLAKTLGMSKEVHDALLSSEEGAARAEAFRKEIKEVVDPLRPILQHNHFEDSVRRTFQRRAL